MEHLHLSFEAFASLTVLLALCIGCVWGLIAGATPGLGTVAALIVALPFSFGASTEASIALFLGIYVTSVFGGAIPAILLNTPGTPQSAATALDGHPMAKSGDADLALGWASLASLVGGLVSLSVLIFAAPSLAKVSTSFGPAAIFAVIVFTLVCIACISIGNMAKGLLCGMIGLWLSTIGPDDLTGSPRFEFGIEGLSGGLSLVPIMIGVFALSEVFHRAVVGVDSALPVVSKLGIRFPSLREIAGRIPQFLRASVIGTAIGVLPGTGATAATFLSYFEAKRSSPRSKNFGQGEPDGVIAAEASNNAVTGGALIPTLALGIPGDGATVVLLSVLAIQGLTPGYDLIYNNAHILTGTFIVLLFANLIMFALGILGARLFARILLLPEQLLMAGIVTFSLVGAYIVRGSTFDVITCAVAGVLGTLLRMANYPVAPIVVGMALGTIFESKLRQGMISARGDFVLFLSDPLALCILGLTACVVISPLFMRRKG